DPDKEIAAYLGDPHAFVAALPARIIPRALAQAKKELAQKKIARALGQANRVLGWQPNQPEAVDILNSIEQRGGWVKWLAAVALLAAIAGGVALKLGLKFGSKPAVATFVNSEPQPEFQPQPAAKAVVVPLEEKPLVVKPAAKPKAHAKAEAPAPLQQPEEPA